MKGLGTIVSNFGWEYSISEVTNDEKHVFYMPNDVVKERDCFKFLHVIVIISAF